MPKVKLDVNEAPSAEGINGEMQALYIALKHLGQNVPFATLMGVGGLAFRIYWHVGRDDDGTKGEWSESSLEACGGLHPLYMACQFIGYSYVPYLVNTLDQFYTHARDSIDRGVPAITRGPVGPPISNLIVGYEEEATRKLDILSKFTGGQVTSLEIPMFDLPMLEYGAWRNPIFIVEKGEAPAEAASKIMLVEAFGRCAEVLNCPAIDDGRWVGGVKVYDMIASDIENPDRLDEVMPGVAGQSEECDDDRVFFLSDFLGELGRARGTAFEFLDTYADEYKLDPVARAYEKTYETSLEIRDLFPSVRDNPEAAHEAFYNDATRKDLADLIRKMGKQETKAAEIMQSKLEKLMEMDLGDFS